LDDSEYNEVLQLYEKLVLDNKEKKAAGKHDYSLMNALLKSNDEVNLHSRFIYSMINPTGLHYCGDTFLNIFLEQISCIDFLDITKAKVFREKGNIDLLIHDDYKFIIIENKLNAPDQEYQITRYIKYVKERFLAQVDDLSDKIQIVYLAKNKPYPSKKSKSLIGFEKGEGENAIKWKGKGVPELGGFSLKSGTKIPYIHINYSKHIKNWSDESRRTDECKKKGLVHVFDEYELILRRLNKHKSWKNIMELFDYYSNLKGDEDKNRMYRFMVESRDALPKLISKEISDLFTLEFKEGNTQLPLGTIVPKEDIAVQVSYEDFNNKCLDWLNKKGYSKGWKDIGLVLVDKNGRYWCFIMRSSNIYFETVELSDSGAITVELYFLKENLIASRNDLLKKSGLIGLKEKVKLILKDNFLIPSK